MKVIKYNMVQNGTLYEVMIGYNESSMQIAQKEAFNGEYTIEDVDFPDDK